MPMSNIYTKYVIVDLDGTLCLNEHRQHFLEETPKNWDGFFKAASRDKVNPAIKRIIDDLTITGVRVVFMTGRSDKYRALTERWLTRNAGVNGTQSPYMRDKDDFRSDTVVKPELLAKFMKNADVKPEQILFMLEDRGSMVKKWRELGYVCLQVAEGDF